MYFMLAGAMDRFHLLKYGLAAVLVFVGLKMVWLNEAFGGKFPISWSLCIILALVGAAAVASLLFPRGLEGKGTARESGTRSGGRLSRWVIGPRERKLAASAPFRPRSSSESQE